MEFTHFIFITYILLYAMISLGIGRYLCIEAQKRGAFVYAVDRDEASLAKLETEVFL